MKKILIFIGVLFTLVTSGFAQIKNRGTVINLISNSIFDTYKRPVENKIIMLSIWLSTDASGKIDSVYFSDISAPLSIENVIKTSFIKKEIKEKCAFIKVYPNALIVLPIMYRRPDDLFASHLFELGKDFTNLFPDQSKFPKKKIIVERPASVAVHDEIN